MTILPIDITSDFDIALNQIFNLFAYVFNQMNSITFHNTSILMIFLGITILGIALPIFLTLSKNIVGRGERIVNKRSERDDNE